MQAGRANSFARPAAFFWRAALGGVALICLLVATARGQDDEGLRVRKVGPNLYRIGTVLLDARQKTIRCTGHVNMAEGGPIELLACLPRGKTHESVFTLDVKPMDLHVALLLLGLREGRNPAFDYPEYSPDREKRAGDKVWIFVEWRPKDSDEDAEPRRVRAEQFLYDVKLKQAVSEADWAFLGSRLLEDGFGADIEGTVITTYHDPVAILELALPTVNDDIFYDVNKELCPPVDTVVELVIQVPPKKEADPPKERI